MSSNSKEIAKLKKKYSKWPPKTRPLINRSVVFNYLPASVSVWILRYLLIRSDYRLKRESYKYFDLSNRAYGANKALKCKRLFGVATGLLESNFPNGYKRLLRSAISATIQDPSDRVSTSSSILIATQNLVPTTFDATSWYQLSRGLFSLGYFRAAWFARENSLDLSIAEGLNSVPSVTVVNRMIEAQLERRNFDFVRNWLMQNTDQNSKSQRSFRETLNWFEGHLVENSLTKKSENNGSVRLFDELVRGKQVVLVGPGVAHGEYGEEIDSADIVARIKYPGSEYLIDQRLFGKRCDISQYPGLNPLRDLANLSSYEYFDDLRLIVTGEEDSSAVRNTPVFSENQDLPMYRTNVTSGLRLLTSLIRQSPSSLKIFGYDFYSEVEPYNTGMKSFYERAGWKIGDGFLLGTHVRYPKVEITSSFAGHDPLSNFCFAQNLYKAGLFDIEPYGKSILELSPYQYVERLEEMLGDW